MTPRRLSPWLAHAGAALLALAVHGLLWSGSYEVFSSSIDFNSAPLEDFMGPYYGTARALARGEGPAPGFLYGPFFALLVLPFAHLGPVAASWTWLALELLASAALIVLGVLVVRPRSVGLAAAYTFVATLAFPLAHNLHWGQVSAPLGALVLGAVLAHARGAPRSAAWLLGAATAIKGYPGLFALVFALERDRRALGHFVLALAVCALGLPALVFGAGRTVDLWNDGFGALRATASAAGLWHHSPNKQFLGAVLARVLDIQSAGGRAACAAVSLVLAGLVVAGAARRAWGSAEGLHSELATRLALALPLVVSPSWPHYLVLLPFAQLELANRRGEVWARALVALSVVLSSSVFFRAIGDPAAYGRAGWLAWAHVLLIPVACSRSALGVERTPPAQPLGRRPPPYSSSST